MLVYCNEEIFIGTYFVLYLGIKLVLQNNYTMIKNFIITYMKSNHQLTLNIYLKLNESNYTIIRTMLDKHEHTKIKISSQTIACNYIWHKKLNLASLEVWPQLFISRYNHQHAGIILLDVHALHFINIKRTMVKDLNVSLRTKLYKVSLSKRK
jgi:hypothetical protein